MAQIPSYFLCLCRTSEAMLAATDLWSQSDLCSFLHTGVQLTVLTLKSYTENWITQKDAKKGVISNLNKPSTALSGGFQPFRIQGLPRSHFQHNLLFLVIFCRTLELITTRSMENIHKITHLMYL